jgi:hypothetical protein
VTDPRSLTTTYTTDGLGNTTQLQSPDTGTTALRRLPRGRLQPDEGRLVRRERRRGREQASFPVAQQRTALQERIELALERDEQRPDACPAFGQRAPDE